MGDLRRRALRGSPDASASGHTEGIAYVLPFTLCYASGVIQSTRRMHHIALVPPPVLHHSLSTVRPINERNVDGAPEEDRRTLTVLSITWYNRIR